MCNYIDKVKVLHKDANKVASSTKRMWLNNFK